MPCSVRRAPENPVFCEESRGWSPLAARCASEGSTSRGCLRTGETAEWSSRTACSSRIGTWPETSPMESRAAGVACGLTASGAACQSRACARSGSAGASDAKRLPSSSNWLGFPDTKSARSQRFREARRSGSLWRGLLRDRPRSCFWTSPFRPWTATFARRSRWSCGGF